MVRRSCKAMRHFTEALKTRWLLMEKREREQAMTIAALLLIIVATVVAAITS